MHPLLRLLPALLFAWPMAVKAQECALVLSGRVIDDHDRTPLSLAEIFLFEIGRGTISDMDGHYRITGLCPGTYQVRVTHLGCEPVEP